MWVRFSAEAMVQACISFTDYVFYESSKIYGNYKSESFLGGIIIKF